MIVVVKERAYKAVNKIKEKTYRSVTVVVTEGAYKAAIVVVTERAY